MHLTVPGTGQILLNNGEIEIHDEFPKKGPCLCTEVTLHFSKTLLVGWFVTF
jgi:hypothetical protein